MLQIRNMKQLLELEDFLRRQAAALERIRRAEREQQELEALVAKGKELLDAKEVPNGT